MRFDAQVTMFQNLAYSNLEQSKDSCKPQSSSPHVRSIEAISGITSWTVQRPEALAHPLRLLHLQLKGSGTLINLLQLCKMAVENPDDLGKLDQGARSVTINQEINVG